MISPLAFVDPAAKLGKNVTVQPFAYIEGDVEIGDDCIIMSGARILNGTRMGQKNKVHHGAVLGTTPQDFHYTGEKSLLIIGDQNDIRENVVVSRATHEGDATRIGNENFLMDGVTFAELAAPVKQADGMLTCERMVLGQADASGRRSPVGSGEFFDIPKSEAKRS